MNPFINRLRGILAFLVALGHASYICYIFPTTDDFVRAALKPAVMYSGFNYVIGFFVLSGYCIARSTLNHPFSFASYVALRVTRIYPALIACGLLAGLVEASLFSNPNRIAVWESGIDFRTFLWNLTGTGGLLANQFGSYAPIYTVSYELLYYAVWGLVLACFRVKAALFGMTVAMLMLGWAREFSFPIVLSAIWMIGAAIALYQDPISKIMRKFPLWLVWLVCLIAFFWGNSAFSRFGVVLWQLPGSLCTIACGLLFAAIIASHLARTGAKLFFDDWLGDISYPLFLAHGPVIIFVGSVAKAAGLTASYGILLSLLLGSSLVVAQVIVIFVERPIMSWRRHLHGKHPPADLGAPHDGRLLGWEQARLTKSR
jgi:peptidoglycan/LPS O-acetylase OafA/YrhL